MDERAGLQDGSTEPADAAGDATESGLERDVVARSAKAKLFGAFEPVRVGRYALLEPLGTGAMGIVYAAFDQSLDRKVAIKLIHPERARGAKAMARERFLREAKAMARVSHANVVQVYEAAESEGRVFLAMELVPGTTLRTWMLDPPGPKPWRVVARMFVAVAQGLEAAHEAGVVHRDFKPDNVLVTPGGQPKIADFGLAGLEPTSVEPVLRDLSGDETALTATGATMGTPLYMSAEQYAGRRVDARSDQFSFCVAMYEALYGERPFEGATQVALAASVIEGRRRAVPGRGVPARIRRAIDRGLLSDPDARWPSMRALRVELEAASGSGRSWWWGAGAVGLVMFATYWASASRGAVQPCADADAGLAGVWDDDVRDAIEARRLDGLAGSPADQAWAELRPRIDTFAERWRAARTEGCRAHADGSLSDELYDRRQTCLDAVLRELDAVTTSLSTLEGAWVEHAASLAPDDDAIARCTDPVRLTAGPLAPSEGPGRERWLDVRESLVRAETAVELGHAESALQMLHAIEADDATDDDALATALRLRGKIAQASGEAEAAADLYLDAVAHADRAHDDDARARALIDAVWVVGVDLYGGPEATRLGTQARGALARAGDHPGLRADLESGLGMTAMYAGRFDDAVRLLQRAVEHAGDDPLARPQLAVLLGDLASAELRAGREGDAIPHLRRAADLLAESLGPDHPQAVRILNNLGVAQAQAGEHADALATHRRSLAAREALYGAGHLETANALNGIGLALVELGRPREAVEPLEASLELREAGGGRDEDLAEARFALARALAQRDPPRARDLAVSALELYTTPRLAGASEREAAAVAEWLRTHEPSPTPEASHDAKSENPPEDRAPVDPPGPGL